MDRRDLLKSIAILTGGTLIGGDALLSSFTLPNNNTLGILSAEQVNLLNELGETILPTTARSKGARAANVGSLISLIVNDCYTKKEQTKFIESLEKLNTDILQSNQKTFLKASTAEKTKFLTALDHSAHDFQKEKQLKEMEDKKNNEKFIAQPNHYFVGIKQVILWAYFNSEIGATQALRFVSVPTRFDGCVPYHKGDRSWY